MSDRTSEQALKDAKEAYLAWCDGKPIEYRWDSESQFTRYPEIGESPNFSAEELYWRPAEDQPPEQSPPRTPQQAMRDARESGAVEAWENGKPIECSLYGGPWEILDCDTNSTPAFSTPSLHWRPKASGPPKPVALDWRPTSEPPADGQTVLVWDGYDWIYERWSGYINGYYQCWAPMPLPPEVK